MPSLAMIKRQKTTYFYNFFSLYSYNIQVPFTVKRDNISQEYYLKSSLPRKVREIFESSSFLKFV